DAYDVAAYILSMKCPVMPDLEKDFPIRLQKLVDTPYPPYSDAFSPEHTFDPFGPIRARLQDLAAQSGVENPGGPDNGSNEADRQGFRVRPLRSAEGRSMTCHSLAGATNTLADTRPGISAISALDVLNRMTRGDDDMTRVLLVGLEPEAVDYSDPALP